MNEKHESTLTTTEAEIMNVIWEQSPTTVQSIADRLDRELAYTSVMTMVNILEQKGFVRRCGKEVRAYLYEPIVAKQDVQGSMLRQLADRLFGGSLKSMVLNMVQQQQIATEDLDEMKRIIAKLESRK